MEVEAVGADMWRMLEHPVVSDWCGLEDVCLGEIGDDEVIRLKSVVSRGPWRTLVVVVGKENRDRKEFALLVDDLERQGGRWHLDCGSVLFLHAPKQSAKHLLAPWISWMRMLRDRVDE